jgi:hypothetical protein
MESSASRLEAQARGWKTLRGLHPRPVDLARIGLIRERSPSELACAGVLEALLPRLGLNDEGLDEFPPELHPFCGQGLRIWQYPTQFGRYLAHVAALGVRSYVEIGVRHGGSFIATVEVLERFRPLDYALAVDIIPCPALAEYAGINDRARYVWLNTQTAPFGELLARLPTVDLAFVDSHHEEAQCRREVAILAEHANMIALHDISNAACPGVAQVWGELKGSRDFACFEYTDRYAGLGPAMGIGLAVKAHRLTQQTDRAPGPR